MGYCTWAIGNISSSSLHMPLVGFLKKGNLKVMSPIDALMYLLYANELTTIRETPNFISQKKPTSPSKIQLLVANDFCNCKRKLLLINLVVLYRSNCVVLIIALFFRALNSIA